MDLNSITDLKTFFSTPEKPVSLQEIREFYRDLSEDEKDYYKNADLTG